jgi:hypothetical protein
MKIKSFRNDEGLIISILQVTMNDDAPEGAPPRRFSDKKI